MGRAARLRLHPHALARHARRARVADPGAPGRDGDRELEEARPRDLGGARRAEALHVLEDVLLGGLRPRRAAGRRCARTRSTPSAGSRSPTRSTPTCCEHGVDDRGVFVQHYETDALDAALLLAPAAALPAARRRADPQHGVRDRRRADRERPRAPLPDRGDRRRPDRARGQLPDLLVLARLGVFARSARSTTPATCASGCSATPARSASTPRRSIRRPVAISATSRRRSPTSR